MYVKIRLRPGVTIHNYILLVVDFDQKEEEEEVKNTNRLKINKTDFMKG